MATPTTQPPASTSTQGNFVHGNSVEDDPFKRLHRMSTTAGVGSTDYVAVNTPSVVAATAGIASGLALISPVLLVVPAFSVVCALIGWVQVGRSNGTQTGRLLCALGLLFSLAIGGYVINREVAAARAFAESRREIGALFTRFAEATAVGDYEAAYAVFGPSFKSQFSFQTFSNTLDQIASFPTYGRITSARWNERLEAVPDVSGQGNDFARASIRIGFEKSPEVGLNCDVVLVRRRSDERWVIEQMLPLFQRGQGE